MQLSLAAELCTRSELPDTGECGRLLRMNGERSRAVDMAFGLAEEKLVREDRDHRRRRGKKPRSARAHVELYRPARALGDIKARAG